jgi:prevent-host-death family protein
MGLGVLFVRLCVGCEKARKYGFQHALLASQGFVVKELDFTYTVQVSYFLRSPTMITVTSVEAQNRFGQLLDTVQREPVTITRHGRTAAFIVSPQDMVELTNARSKRSNAVAEFEAWSRRAATSALPAAAELTDEDVLRMVKESR